MIGNYTGVIAVLIGLHIFGWLYNAAVCWAKPRGYLEPYMSLWVAFGSAITILGMGVMEKFADWSAMPLALACFGASGSPMMIGSGVRYVKELQAEKDALREVIHDQAAQVAKE